MTIGALYDVPMLEKVSRSAERLRTILLVNTRKRYCTNDVLRSALKLLPSGAELHHAAAGCWLLAVITASVPYPILPRRAGIRFHLRSPNRGLLLASVVGLVHSYVQLSRSKCKAARRQKGCPVMPRILASEMKGNLP